MIGISRHFVDFHPEKLTGRVKPNIMTGMGLIPDDWI